MPAELPELGSWPMSVARVDAPLRERHNQSVVVIGRYNG